MHGVARVGIRAVALGLAFATLAAAAQPFPELLSRSSAGANGSEDAWLARPTPDGRYVAYASAAPNLVAGDTNGTFDVFVRDRATATTARVSVGPAGAQAVGGDSGYFGPGSDFAGLYVSISDDGQRIAFVSNATNLVAGDGNLRRDAFVHDRSTGSTTLVSRSTGGTIGNGDTTEIAISGDGRFVAFTSGASNLITGDTNNEPDVFVRELASGTTERISLDSADAQIVLPSGRGSSHPVITRDGREVFFLNEGNVAPLDCPGQCPTVYVRDRQAGTTTTVSLRHDGTPGTGQVFRAQSSPDGRYVVFSASGVYAPGDTDTLTEDVYLRDRQLGTTEHLCQDTAGTDAALPCETVSVSADGRYVAFTSRALAPDDTNFTPDAYVRDRVFRQTVRVSVTPARAQANCASEAVRITPDARLVTFQSCATNLVPGGTNRRHVYLTTNPFLFEPPARLGATGTLETRSAKLTADGRYLFFLTMNALVAGDSNGMPDVYRRDLSTQAVVRVSVDNAGSQLASGAEAFSVSDDGNRVAFTTVDDGSVALQGESARAKGTIGNKFVARRDVSAATTLRMGPAGATATAPAISGDGNVVVLVSPSNGLVAGDGNGLDDVYSIDAATGAVMARESTPSTGDSNGASRAPTISRNGMVVAFETDATNLATSGAPDSNGTTDVLVVDKAIGDKFAAYPPGGVANGASGAPTLSPDGTRLAFASLADNLRPGDGNGLRDVFVYELARRGIERVSESAGGADGNGASDAPGFSGDGNVVAFRSSASNLVPDDSNASADVFAFDLLDRRRRRQLALTDGGRLSNAESAAPALSHTGEAAAFDSIATNYSLADTNGAVRDVFVVGDPLNPLAIFRSGFE